MRKSDGLNASKPEINRIFCFFGWVRYASDCFQTFLNFMPSFTEKNRNVSLMCSVYVTGQNWILVKIF